MSQDDQLLRQLAELAREPGSGTPTLDERWERLAAGTLSAEEDAELRRLAETSAEARETYEAFRPLGTDFQAGVVRAIREQRAAPPTPAPGKVLRFRPALRRVAAWSATAAAAAAVLFFVWPAPPVPGYTLAELSGGTRATRADVPELPDFAPGDRVQATVRPDTEVARAGSLAVRCSLVRGEEVRPLAVESQLDPGGSVRVAGTLDRDLPAGEWTLWIVVGRRGKLPDSDTLRAAPQDARIQQPEWVAVPVVLRVHP